MKKIRVKTKEGEIKEIDINLLKYLSRLYRKFPNDFWLPSHIDALVKQSRDEILSGAENLSKLDPKYLNALSGIKGMRASPVKPRMEDVFLGYPSLPPYAFAVEWEFRGLKNGHINLGLKEMKEKIERKISSSVDPEELGRMYEDGFSVSLEKHQSVFGVNSSKIYQRMIPVSERRREIGRLISDRLFLFTDPDDNELLEIRSPPCGDPQSLEKFLNVATEAIGEAQASGKWEFVPFGVVDGDTLFSANMNVHIKIPTPEDLKLLGYSIEAERYKEVPLVMANAIRNYYAVLSSHSRNSMRPESKIWWLEKFLQVREFQDHHGGKDFMVGDRFSWDNYDRSVSGMFRPNIGIRKEYWTIEVNMDGQGSVPEILSDAQLIASIAYKQLETFSGKKNIERDYLAPGIEDMILNEELSRVILTKRPRALIPSMNEAKDFENIISYSLRRDVSAAVESLVESDLLKEIPMSQVRSELAEYSSKLWDPKPDVLNLMTADKPESGSHRQRLEAEKHGYKEMVAKASENLYENRKWRA